MFCASSTHARTVMLSTLTSTTPQPGHETLTNADVIAKIVRAEATEEEGCQPAQAAAFSARKSPPLISPRPKSERRPRLPQTRKKCGPIPTNTNSYWARKFHPPTRWIQESTSQGAAMYIGVGAIVLILIIIVIVLLLRR